MTSSEVPRARPAGMPRLAAFLEQRPALAPLTVAAFFTLLAAGRQPGDFYVFLRCMLAVAAVFLAVAAVRSRAFGWLAVAVGVFVLWSPARIITLGRLEWQAADVLGAALLLFAGMFIPAPAAGPSGVPRRPWWHVALAVCGIGAFVTAMLVGVTGAGDPACTPEQAALVTTCFAN